MNTKLQILYDILKYLAVILFICAFGLALVNQYIQYRYEAQLLGGPCQLCAELNPIFKECTAKTKVHPTSSVPLNYTLKIDTTNSVSE